MNNVNNASMQNYNVNNAEIRVDRFKPDKAVKINDVSQANNTVSEITETTKQELQKALEVVNQAAIIEQRSLSFTVDELSGRSIIKVVDQQTEQLIRQIPTEELLKVAQDIKKLQDEMGLSLGLLIDRKV